MKIIKEIFMTILYGIVLLLILSLINWGFGLIMKHIIVPIFAWFYDIHWFWKLVLIFFGGTVLVTFFLNIFNWLAIIFSTLLNAFFPYNKVTVIISWILVGLNIFFLEKTFWSLLIWDFWIICFWLILAFFILQVNLVFIYRDSNER